ncbi:KPN_02809 family neutral zinc metallopeptidase [Arsenicicoccus sp. oral taxon 190]|uniref:KPN_02809 family neutral zinc metallopeptidase n=1 Tax=Arsenicicoccus sp. oral taxon 190 TaxID=1658671 RepID=UPI00067A0543|nr:neutral zinc metallopeptidase [Arsenicicoccus sp. oral taxon 190]AKT51967.1 membrane protein [Arsenicicoccus sp. oral taxon 190]
MSFNDDAQLDTSQVERGGGGGMSPGGMIIGGGGGLGLLGLLVVLLLQMCGGGNASLPTDSGAQNQSQGQQDLERCKTGADANSDVECRVVGTVNSVQAYWAKVFPEQAGRNYANAKTSLYQGREQSACGTASNQVGPFYCPTDRKVYIDASFFNLLTKQFGADDGALAQEYVVAHEYGHHIQNQLGLLQKAQQDPQGPQSGGVRVELMADCLAGMWAKDASTVPGKNGKPFLKPLTQQDINSALSAAKAVGDDHIQSSMGSGQVNPESWTHGSSQARQRWFMTGYSKGSLQACNTFAVDRVE